MTIEEKARLNLQYEKDFLGRNLSDDMVCRAYIKGAAEQKAIDFDKAREWFADYLMEIGYPDDWMRDSQNMESGEERFIKVMEEYMNYA